MWKVEKPNEFGSLNLEKLNDIENEFGNLPSEFRSSLIATNGGRSILSCFKGENGDLYNVNYFYGISKEKYRTNIDSVLSSLRNRIPNDYLPFAGDSGGNHFLLKLGSEEKSGRNSVYFWDHNLEFEGQTDNSNISKVCDSFVAFIYGLFNPDPLDVTTRIEGGSFIIE
jgi:hypothetical protein